MTVDDGAVVGAAAVYDLAPSAVGVPADFPHLAAYATFALPASAPVDAAPRPGQVAVAAFDAAGALVDATGVQIPGVLDDVYGGAARRDLGVTWSARRAAVRASGRRPRSRCTCWSRSGAARR